ncbi:MAG TPA: toll/interleukin-1 receptor domain-containing protein [Ktedonobacteraceae bacterium]|nr:toll/interleukin-1 receptor domain-containing protein [Ktedonobacteraceae bacterium]
MIEQATEATVADLASFLKARKSRGQRLGLFVGSRAGALLGDDNLYKILMHHISATNDGAMLLKQPAPLLESHLQALNNLSALARFKECYDILSKHFSESGIHFILVQALKPIRYREVDDLLAGFFKGGFFDPIITTNIDTLLEDSCKVLWSMQQPSDYQVISYGMHKSEEMKQGETKYGRIMKIFGDLSYLKYKTVGNEFNLEDDQVAKQYLQTKLIDEVLVIGYDPTWDRPIEQAFPEFGGTLWYVNDELPAQNTHLMRVLNQRKGRYLMITQGTINDFLKALRDEIGEGVSRNAEMIDASAAPPSQAQVRKKAFISYSHKNKEQLERLQIHLKGYLHAGDDLMGYWDDTQISSGANWEEAIKDALKDAKVAALLVSADFLASDFIRQYELPALLKAAQAKEITLLSVLLGPCAFARMPLYKYQAISGISQPLMGMTPYEQDVIWAKLAER